MIRNARIVAKDVNSEEYHAPIKGKERGTPGFPVSSSSLRQAWTCFDKWRTPIVGQDGKITFYEFGGSDATRYGDMFDVFVLTPQQFADRYVQVPPDAPRKPSSAQRSAAKPSPETVKAIAWWDAFEERNEKKTIISDAEAFKVRQAARRFMEFPGIKRFIDSCDRQVWLEGEWFDKDTKLTVPTKCLIDLLPNLESEYAILDPAFAKCTADVKTTCNAHRKAWRRWAHKAKYEIQAFWNIAHVIALDGREINGFNFLLSESHAPYQPGKRIMTRDEIEKRGDVDSGERQVAAMMKDYCKALATGYWPGYDDFSGPDTAEGGWSIVQPDPWDEQERVFDSEMTFGEEVDEEDAEFVSETPT